ncbi:hypothetical protein [Thalassotalea sp. PP2-459]|uniref:hypothetical protein n=1 Tax=Thalassotalea sp. PP2-459 TaxID=1742724 RepID=UPI00094523FB|nr:hypothetical protein [Thalassotalea sp. PP2-459]OKY28067.1 hypothetical protein BI291_17925 [Thalassotalea sp. PP2-459]
MYKGSYTAIFICLVILFIGTFYYYSQKVNNDVTIANENNISTDTPALKSSTPPDLLNPSKHPSLKEKKATQKKETLVKNTVAETDAHEGDKSYKKFLNQEKFRSNTTVDSVYLDDSEVVQQKAIFKSLINNDFSLLVEKLDSIKESKQAFEREMKIQHYLTNSLDFTHYNEKYSCAGKVCAVTFIFENKSNKKQLESFGDFDSNFSFGNFSINESGENVYKGVFIKTDDPSKLAVSTK